MKGRQTDAHSGRREVHGWLGNDSCDRLDTTNRGAKNGRDSTAAHRNLETGQAWAGADTCVVHLMVLLLSAQHPHCPVPPPSRNQQTALSTCNKTLSQVSASLPSRNPQDTPTTAPQPYVTGPYPLAERPRPRCGAFSCAVHSG